MDKTILIKETKTRRKCSICKEFICLEDDFDNILYYGTTLKNKTLQHKKCLKKKMLSKKGNGLLEGDIDILIEDFFKDGMSHVDSLIYRNHLYLYLMNVYDIIELPNYFYTKIEQVFNGKLEKKGIKIKHAIPPEHLLDMWQRKQSFLDGLYHKEKINGISRVSYDLAVLIARYPSYLDWIGKTKTEEKEIVQYISKQKIDFNNVKSNKKIENSNIFDDEE